MTADLDQFEHTLRYRFNARPLLIRALTHKSYSHETRDGARGDNETFEFLGDSVLGFVIGHMLFERFPQLDEGGLSKMKAFLVSSPSLAKKARALGMGDVLLLGIGEEKSGGRRKDSLLANLFEAVIAAIFLDGGIEPARKFIEENFTSEVDQINERDLLFRDYKTALQEVAQGLGLPLPQYDVVAEIGPDHEKRFVVPVKMADIVARGEGSSKKEGQQEAAREALRMYSVRDSDS
jgi:ribonuclease III